MIIQIKHQNNIGEKEKIRTFWLKGLFLIYVVFLISMVFLDHSFRSHTNSYFPSGYIFSSEHLETINIIPFKDLFRFDSRIGLLNFVVNLILLAPIGFFFPLLCANKNKSIKNFIVLILSSTFVIEIIQFLTATGSSDINDIILNTLGAIAFYMLMKTKLIKRLLEIILDLS
jgi:glycopeptide antibiotics resistance protein